MVLSSREHKLNTGCKYNSLFPFPRVLKTHLSSFIRILFLTVLEIYYFFFSCLLLKDVIRQVISSRTFCLCYNMQAIAKSVGDWYFDRANVKSIDCAYPCDKTCHNLAFNWTGTKNFPPTLFDCIWFSDLKSHFYCNS